MTAATHYAFSYLLCSAAGFEQPTALVSSLAALLPDIDHPESLVGRIFLPLSKYIQRRYGHRTVTHSIFAILSVSLALSPLLFLGLLLQVGKFPTWYAALVLAYASHIFIDLFNKSGVRLFSPFSQKEYISFRTPELRVLVSSWQEYVVLFVIVFLAFTVSGEDFSIHKAARTVGRFFYKTYDAAVKDFQENSQYLCIAHVDYFDQIERRKVVEDLPVLTMYPEKAVFLRNGDRFVLRKDYIEEITVDKSNKKVTVKKLSGSDLSLLRKVPPGSYITGTVDIKNFIPELKSSEFLSIEKRVDGALITLKCASPHEIAGLVNLDKEIERQLEGLKRKLCSYQISQLRNEESRVKKRIEILRDKGLYDNYGSINRLTSELKKIQSKIGTLEIKESMGGDAEIEDKLSKLANSLILNIDINAFIVLGKI
jgi:membrane-bound metal-dependent hydrolase YbcI (DUF457 family)